MSESRHSARHAGQEPPGLITESSAQEELLRRGLVRVSIAADGQDPLLDKRLHELRNALRSEAPADLLADMMPELERAILAADSARQDRLKQITANLKSQVRQLQEYSDSQGAGKSLRQLLKALDQPLEYTSSLLPLLDSLLEAQSMVLNGSGSDEPRSGLWSRLFQRGGAETGETVETPEAPELAPDSPAVETAPARPAFRPVVGNLSGDEQNYSQVAAHIEAILLSLLGELQVLDTQQDRCERLRSQVSKGLNWYELAAVLDELTVLVLAAQQNRQSDFEHYLIQLNSRLTQFQGSLEQTQTVYNDSLESGRTLEGQICDQVQDLHEDVRGACDLDTLKANVEAKLESLLNNVDQAKQLREQREAEVAEHLQGMIERIQVMEVEAQTFNRHLEEQRQRALIDSLTGLANRAGLQRRMEEEFERWQRYGGELLLAVLDIDHFKSINDNFGHLAGDKVLRLIAQQLSRRLRKSDFIGRFGGEEFVLLLPGTSLEQGMQVLEQLRADIHGSPFHFKNKPVSITVSMGFTEFRHGDTLDQVFDRADNAMYKAKDAGRNRIIQAD